MEPEALTNEQVYVIYKTDTPGYIAWLKAVSHARCQEFLAFARFQNEMFMQNIADQVGVSTDGIIPKKN